MSFYYPQAAVKLRILLEDFKLSSDPTTQVPYETIVIPRSLSVNVNDYKTTDTFTMELDYKNFPFDPRTIRYCGVVVHIQDMGALYRSDGSLNKIVPSVANTVFSGFVDDSTIEFNDDTQTVKFEGRDFTALLIDQKYLINTPLDLTQPVDVIIRQLLASFKATQELKVVNLTSGVLPTLASQSDSFTSKLGSSRNSGPHETYWEIIQDLANRAGLVCYIHFDQLILTTPINQDADNVDDIKFIYGKNIRNLELKRKLGRFKGFNIRVRCRSGKDVITADIPREATDIWAKAFGIAKEDVTVPVLKPDGSLDTTTSHPGPFITFPVSNVSNKDALITRAQTIYEQYSLQQVEGSLETFEMLGRGSNKPNNPKTSSVVYDLTQIRKGKTIAIEIDPDDMSAISRLATTDQRTHYLVTKNYDRTIATIFARTIGRFSPRFYIKSYSMSLDDSAWKLKINFLNVLDLDQNRLT